MRHMIRCLALFLALLPTAAAAQQYPFTLPANTVIGRVSAPGDSGTAQAVPFAQLTAQLFASGAAATLPVANGGTGEAGVAWTTYTPAPVCGTATWTVNSATSKTWGKVTFIQLDVTVATIGSCVSGFFSFTTANTPQSGGGLAGRETLVVGTGLSCNVAPSAATATCALASGLIAAGHRYQISGVYANQ